MSLTLLLELKGSSRWFFIRHSQILKREAQSCFIFCSARYLWDSSKRQLFDTHTESSNSRQWWMSGWATCHNWQERVLDVGGKVLVVARFLASCQKRPGAVPWKTQFQLTHRRAWRSSSAKLILPLGKCIFKRGKCCLGLRNEEKTSVKNSSGDIKVRQERGGRGIPGAGAEIPLQPLEDHTGADNYTAVHGRRHVETGGHFLKKLQPVESPH